MKKIFFLVLFFGCFIQVRAQVLQKSWWKLGEVPESAQISGNDVTDISVNGNAVWLGTGEGLSKTTNSGQTWLNFNHSNGLGKGGVSAMAISGDTLLIATGFDTLTKDAGSLPAGGGLSLSFDGGATWKHIPQPGATPVQNVTFDIAILNSTLWIASYGGGLRKSNNWGQTWRATAPDTFIFDPFAHLNHRAFSVITAGHTLWVGTAGGINRSTDGGKSWVNFNHQNQPHPISGNFVVALAYQHTGGRDIIWAATNPAVDSTEFRAVSWSDDQGYTWHTTLKGEFAHNFAFDDSTVYVATDNGLFKSIDGGQTWAHFPPIIDSKTNVALLTTAFYSAGVSPGPVLWAGSSDGLARTEDNGLTWTVFRRFQPLTANCAGKTYAYPNPFSPLRHDVMNGAGHVRFHYYLPGGATVTVKIYDFAMDLVKTVVSGKERPSGGEFDEVWDGTNDAGKPVANGVYFYRIERSGLDPVWGKIMVLN